MTHTAELSQRKQEIFNELKPLLADSLNVPENDITLEKTFKDLNADSLDAVETIMEIEKRYNIAIPDDEMEKFTNMRSIVDYVDEHTKAPAAQ